MLSHTNIIEDRLEMIYPSVCSLLLNKIHIFKCLDYYTNSKNINYYIVFKNLEGHYM